MNEFKLFDFDDLTLSQKRQVYMQARKTANRRIRRLRESGFDAPVQTLEYLSESGHRFFRTAGKNMTDFQVERAWNEVNAFLDAESSTLTGIRKIMKEVRERVENRLNEFREKEDFLDLKSIDEKQFYNFLHSKQFKNMRTLIDSDILIEDFNDALKEGTSFEELMEDYEEYLSKELTFSEMQQRRRYALDKNKRGRS